MLRKLAVALVAPLIAACANEAPANEISSDAAPRAAAVAALQAAPDAVAEVGSGRAEILVELDLPEGPIQVRATAAFSGSRMAMEMDLGPMIARLPEMGGEHLPPGLDEPVRIVTDGETVYVRMPMLDLVTGTAGWLSATPDDLGQSAAAIGLAGAAPSPAQVLDVLRSIADDVVEHGPDEVRGVPTTRYTATIDLRDALDALPAGQRDLMASQLDAMAGSGARSLPIEVRVDDDGLPRRMRVVLDGLGTSMGVPSAATMTIEMFDYGDAIDVAIPPASEVTPLRDVMPSAAGGFR